MSVGAAEPAQTAWYTVFVVVGCSRAVGQAQTTTAREKRGGSWSREIQSGGSSVTPGASKEDTTMPPNTVRSNLPLGVHRRFAQRPSRPAMSPGPNGVPRVTQQFRVEQLSCRDKGALCHAHPATTPASTSNIDRCILGPYPTSSRSRLHSLETRIATEIVRLAGSPQGNTPASEGIRWLIPDFPRDSERVLIRLRKILSRRVTRDTAFGRAQPVPPKRRYTSSLLTTSKCFLMTLLTSRCGTLITYPVRYV